MTQGWSTTTVDAMASTSMKKDVELAQAWAAGMVEWDELPPHVQDAIDEVMAGELPDEQAVADAMTKSEQPLTLLHKSDNEHRFTLGPWYIPNRYDAHGEWTDADELQKALWEYVKSGDRDIRLQHNKDIVAGEWLEAMSFPVPVTIGMNKAEGSQQVTYPSGTVFLGVQWKPWAWELVKEGKIRGFSIGGAAARIEMAMPDDAIAKASFGGDRSAAGRYAAEQRWKGHAKGGEQTDSGRAGGLTNLEKSMMKMVRRYTNKEFIDNAIKYLEKRGVTKPTLPDDKEVAKKLAKEMRTNITALNKEAVEAIKASEEASKKGDREALEKHTKTLQRIKNKYSALARQLDKEQAAKPGVGIPKEVADNNLQTMLYHSAAIIYRNFAKKLDGEIKQNKGIPIWKASFGGDRSAAGRYAANQRWQGQIGGLRAPTTAGEKATEIVKEAVTRVMARVAQADARRRAQEGKPKRSLAERIKYVLSNDYINPEPLMRKWVKEAARLAMQDKTRIADPEVASVVALPDGKQVILDRGKLTTVGKQQPTSSQVHVDTIMGGKKKRKKKPIMVDKAKSPAWQREEGKNPKGGLNAKGRASAKAQGMNLKPPVKSGDNPRRASFLARMGNAKGPEYDEKGEPTRLLLSLRAWGASSKQDARRKAAAISARNKAKETKKAKGGLSEWFDEKWVDLSRPKEGGGFEECGRPDASEGKYPKCVPASTAAKMSEDERKSAIRRKRRAEASERRKDGKPINVPTFKSKNVPTDPKLYARVKAAAKKKFDVYPSAYANAWLVQEYKRRGGGYKVEKAESLDAIVDERIAAARVRAEILKAVSFGGDRSEAGRYAANQRWRGRGHVSAKHMREMRAQFGRGPFRLPKTPEGKQLARSMPSLQTHCDLDAAAAEFKATGRSLDSVDAPNTIYKHLSPERQAKWQEIIRNSLTGVPQGTNPNGSRVFVKAGGGGAGKSSTPPMEGVNVPTAGEKDADGKPTPRNAVMSNADEVKELLPEWGQTKSSGNQELVDRRAAMVHEESAQIAALQVTTAIKSGKDLIVDGTMDNGVEKALGKLRSYRENGAAEVHMLVYSCDTNEAETRAYLRGLRNERKVPTESLRKAHIKVSQNFPQYIEKGGLDTAVVIDTNPNPDGSRRPAEKIYEYRAGGGIKILNQALYNRFLDKRNDSLKSGIDTKALDAMYESEKRTQ